MAFHNVRLPESYTYGSVSGWGFGTIVQQTASGHEYRLARQSQARHRFQPLKRLQSQGEAAELKEFLLGRRGGLHSFRLKDTLDYTTNADGRTAPTATDQVLGTGDGTATQFQLLKVYDTSGSAPYTRTLTLPVSGTTVVALNGTPTTAFTGPNSSGVITMNSAPGLGVVVTAGCEFDVPVVASANVDKLASLRVESYGRWSMEMLECVEVLDEIQWPETWYPGGAKSHDVTGDITIAAADGKLHFIDHNIGAGINAFLPPPDWLPGGADVFVVSVASGASGTVQLRDDAGNTVGSAINAGSTKTVGLFISGSTATWVVY